MLLRLVNWNVEWATRRSPRFSEIRNRIEEHDPEIICLTETYDTMLSNGGHSIYSQADDLGSPSMPPGRFISGITQTSLGEVTVVGVCIPWAMSRVRGSSIEKRKMWQDHSEYLHSLAWVLKQIPSHRLFLMGDFNQRLEGRSNTPLDVRTALQQAIPPGVTAATSTLGYQGRRTIDHIALSDDLVVESLGVISNIDGNRRLSDHFGVFAYLSAR